MQSQETAHKNQMSLSSAGLPIAPGGFSGSRKPKPLWPCAALLFCRCKLVQPATGKAACACIRLRHLLSKSHAGQLLTFRIKTLCGTEAPPCETQIRNLCQHFLNLPTHCSSLTRLALRHGLQERMQSQPMRAMQAKELSQAAKQVGLALGWRRRAGLHFASIWLCTLFSARLQFIKQLACDVLLMYHASGTEATMNTMSCKQLHLRSCTALQSNLMHKLISSFMPRCSGEWNMAKPYATCWEYPNRDSKQNLKTAM